MNPLLSPYTSPHNIPPFDSIRTHHFPPALQEGMDLQMKLVTQIAENSDQPTFKNTIEAFEASGHILQKVKNVFFNYTLALTDEALQEVAKEMAPVLSQHWDNIKLNVKLFERVRVIWGQKDLLHLDQEQHMLLKKTYDLFFKNGASLGEKEKIELKQINEKLSLLTLRFGRNILSENNHYLLTIDNESDLNGLPSTLIEQAKDIAIEHGLSGKWVFTLHQSSVMPFLQYADNRDLRQKIWQAYQLRGNNGDEYDTKEILKETVNLRRRKAQLLGYANYAAFILEDTMAGSAEEVHLLLDQLWAPALRRAIAEREVMQSYIDERQLGFELAPWDWRYFSEKIRGQQFDLDMNELMPYFSLEKVLEGVFLVANRLYGIKLVPLNNVPLYHTQAQAYEVLEADGEHIGILYMDFFVRNSKQSGAWMTKFRSQWKESNNQISPIISVVCNFSKPVEGKPTFLNLDEVGTLFHEFGHALHGLLSNVNYQSLAGTAVPRDFVELPSQIMENWALDSKVIRDYAKHYETGEPISDALLEKINRSQHHDQGFANTEFLAAALLDLAYHSIDKDITQPANEFEQDYLKKIGLIDEILPRYRSTYFNHIFSGGYASQYYSYIWAAVLDADAYGVFQKVGLFDAKTADSFRKNILEKGGSEEALKMYIKFKGSKPDIHALLEKRGLQS